MYTKETPKLPLASKPRTKRTKQVKIRDLEKISPSDTNIAADEVAKTMFFLPLMSAYLGIIGAEVIQPKKKQLPKAPISTSDAQMRSNYCTQLSRLYIES